MAKPTRKDIELYGNCAWEENFYVGNGDTSAAYDFTDWEFRVSGTDLPGTATAADPTNGTITVAFRQSDVADCLGAKKSRVVLWDLLGKPPGWTDELRLFYGQATVTAGVTTPW